MKPIKQSKAAQKFQERGRSQQKYKNNTFRDEALTFKHAKRIANSKLDLLVVTEEWTDHDIRSLEKILENQQIKAKRRFIHADWTELRYYYRLTFKREVDKTYVTMLLSNYICDLATLQKRLPP